MGTGRRGRSWALGLQKWHLDRCLGDGWAERIQEGGGRSGLGHQLGIRLLNPAPPPKQDSALKTLGTEGLFLFSSLDADRDMYISPEEFKPIAEKLTGTQRNWGPRRRDLGHHPLVLALCLL